MSEKIYRVQMNSKGTPNFSTAVEVADRPKGKWIMKDVGRIEYWAICSECGHSNFTEEDIEGGYADSNFCPNCGADMRGGDNE